MIQTATIKPAHFNVYRTFLNERTRMEDLHYAASAMSMFAFFANELAMFAFREARDMIKKTPLYKFSVKKFVNDTEKNLQTCERNMMQHLTKEYFEEYALAGTAALYEDVKKLHYAIEFLLNKHHTPHANALAWCECTRSLLDYACYVYDVAIEEIEKKVGRNYNHILSDFRATAALNSFNQACDILMKNVDKEIDLSKDPMVSTAFKVIENKFTSEELLHKCIDDACINLVGGDEQRERFQPIEWNEFMLTTLTKRFGKVPAKDIAQHLCISTSSVYRKAKELGLSTNKP